jgi:FixJ family two-component response regulator
VSNDVPAHEQAPFVVVVDDDPSVRRALSRLLLSCGLGVDTYSSAEDFLATSLERDVACLVADVQMSGMSGLDLLDHLSAAGGTLPTIVITAHDDAATRERVLKRGATYLRKPFESAAILAAVGRLIGRDLETSDS